jgi:hypothetical protein
MAPILVYLMDAQRTRLLGLEAPEYTPFLLEAEVDFRVIVEEPFGNLLDVEFLVVEVLDLRRGPPGGADEQQRLQVFCGDVLAALPGFRD